MIMSWLAYGTAGPSTKLCLAEPLARFAHGALLEFCWRLAVQGLIGSPRDHGNGLSRQMQSFAGKGIAQNQRVGACPDRIRANRGGDCVFLPHSPTILLSCDLIVLSQGKCSLNMLAHR